MKLITILFGFYIVYASSISKSEISSGRFLNLQNVATNYLVLESQQTDQLRDLEKQGKVKLWKSDLRGRAMILPRYFYTDIDLDKPETKEEDARR